MIFAKFLLLYIKSLSTSWYWLLLSITVLYGSPAQDSCLQIPHTQLQHNSAVLPINHPVKICQ